MVNDIIQVLKCTFNCKIYTENVQQGIIEPCFLITPLSILGNRELQNRFTNTKQYMIQYIPTENSEAFEECTNILKQLLIVMVDVGTFHADSLSGKFTDGVLNFEAVYKEKHILITDKDNMETHKLNERVKNIE